jgi:predicted transport protein
LRTKFADINALRVDVAYPLLLELYHDYATHRVSRDDLARMLLFIESYVFRRAISGIPTNSLNKTFSEFSDGLRKDNYVESFQARLLLLDSYRRLPRDEEFIPSFQTRDVYNLTTRRHYLLRKLENHGRKEPVDVESFTIEHVLPQNRALGPEWQAMLGVDWQHVQEKYLHTIGNLTLTGYNPELSDRPFLKKLNMEGGFKDSPLRLNRELAKLERWTEAEIQTRAEALARLAATVWPEPILDAAVLDQYRPARTGVDSGSYTLGDHPYLVGLVRDLFDQFRAHVMALGPDVTMYVLKQYIAFKATTNFVDVVPQAARLRLSLNMAFADLDDSRDVAEDVTGLGRWGNGDVQIGVSAADQLDYVMTLVQQSYALHRVKTDRPAMVRA